MDATDLLVVSLLLVVIVFGFDFDFGEQTGKRRPGVYLYRALL